MHISSASSRADPAPRTVPLRSAGFERRLVGLPSSGGAEGTLEVVDRRDDLIARPTHLGGRLLALSACDFGDGPGQPLGDVAIAVDRVPNGKNEPLVASLAISSAPPCWHT
jgi:hypothetical protein